MSRSYKKTPSCVYTDTYQKKQSNRHIRRTKDLYNGSMYKKVHQVWYIKECYGMYSFNEYKSKSYNWEGYHKIYENGRCKYIPYTKTEKEVYANWHKYYKMK